MNNINCNLCSKGSPCDSNFCVHCGTSLQEVDTFNEKKGFNELISASQPVLPSDPWFKNRRYQIAFSAVIIVFMLFVVKGLSTNKIYDNKEYQFTVTTPTSWKSVSPKGYVMKADGKLIAKQKVVAVYEVDNGECAIIVKDNPNPIDLEIQSIKRLLGEDGVTVMTVDNRKAFLWKLPDYDKKGLMTSFQIYNNGKCIEMKFFKSKGLSNVRKTQETFDEVAKSFKFY